MEPLVVGSEGAVAALSAHSSGNAVQDAVAAQERQRDWIHSQLLGGTLNPSQQAAVLEVLAGSSRVQLIQGPPGTGETNCWACIYAY